MGEFLRGVGSGSRSMLVELPGSEPQSYVRVPFMGTTREADIIWG